MSSSSQPGNNQVQIKRTLPGSPEQIWELWTTPPGIESWWAPDGFTVNVERLDLRPGGELIYTMTATEPAQIEFMRGAGMPLRTESRKTFTEVDAPRRLAYSSLADFIPDTEPYEFLTLVDLERGDGDTTVLMTVDRMHDDTWTQRLVAGRENELDNLARVLSGGS